MRRHILVLFAAAASESGGAIDYENGEFESTVRKGVKQLAENQGKFRNDIQKVMDDLDRSDKEVKKAMQELTMVKNHCNDFTLTMQKMEKVQKAIALNARSSFRNPIRRALANEEFNFTLNAFARYMIQCKLNGPDAALKTMDSAYAEVIKNAHGKQKALTGVDSGVGQATVPQETFDMIYDLLLEYGDFSTLGVMNIGMRTVVLPLATARPQFYWIGAQTGGQGESSTITSGAFTGGDVLLIVQTVAVLMYIARELLADSTVDLAPWVINQMIESVKQGLDTAAFIGTGNQDQTNAGYVGIFEAGLANTNLAYVALPGHTTTETLTLQDFVNNILNVSPEVLNRNPMWWMHSQILARVSLIRDNNGRPIFQTWLEVPEPGAIGRILGYKVHPTAIAPTTDSNAQPVVVFGDPEGQAVGIRSDLELATSADIGFPQNEMAYRTLMRAGVKMKTIAASTTLKPFSVLQTAPV